MRNSRKVYKSAIIWVFILVILVYFLPNQNMPTQSIVAYEQCFENEDCKKPVKYQFCDVFYECISGRCAVVDIPCKEICYDGLDNDFNGKYDCDDSSCFSSPYCPCSSASFGHCYKGGCYCEDNKRPRWSVSDQGNGCVCIV